MCIKPLYTLGLARNFISSFTVRGACLENEEELKEGIGSYFKFVFEDSQMRRPDVDSGLFRRSVSSDNESWEGPLHRRR